MSGLKQIRRRLGKLYWKIVEKLNTWLYFRKKNWGRFRDWIRGWKPSYQESVPALQKAECLVVCAHPDDETLYFYSVLKKNSPFVICMSGTGSAIRSKEFYKALEMQGVTGLMLNMPDVPYMAWVWKCFAAKRLRNIARHCINVKVIYTHSQTGESHHPHHYASGNAVEQVFSNCRVVTTATDVPTNGDGRLSETDIACKHRILQTCYPSQIKMLETWYPWWKDYLETEYWSKENAD